MTTLLTISQKGQFSLSKDFLAQMGIKAGDKVAVHVEGRRAIIEPIGQGMLEIAGSLGPLHLPKGKTLDGLIDEAHDEGVGHDLG